MNLKAIRALVIFVALFVGLPILGLMVIWHDHCETTLLSYVYSPSRSYRLEQSQIICKGGQIKPAIEIKIAKKNQRDWNDGYQLVLYAGQDKPKIVWPADEDLRIELLPGSELVKSVPTWEGVSLRLDKPADNASEPATTPATGTDGS